MQYVFYDTNTSQLVSNFRPAPYEVDGVTVAMDPSILPGGWVELEVDEGNPPAFDPDTQKVTYIWERQGAFWRRVYTVENLTAEELEQLRINKVPNRITAAQFFRGLWAVLGKDRDEIINIINNIANTDEKRQRVIDLYHSNTIARNSAFVSFIQNHYGYTDLQVDNFFTNAKSL